MLLLLAMPLMCLMLLPLLPLLPLLVELRAMFGLALLLRLPLLGQQRLAVHEAVEVSLLARAHLRRTYSV
eukprot:1195047-Prorocentrum_minimum.AAC.4